MRICAWLITATLLGCFGTARSAERLLLTEVVVAPTQAEYIAIFNPNLKTVYLKDYYLADYETYYLVVDGTPPTSNSDFLVRFPQEASIGPGQTQYLSIAGAECFKTACGTVGPFVGFGVYPTYEIASSIAANNSNSVLDMRVPIAGAVGSSRSLTNAGEPVMLFYWDGVAELVIDVDYVYYGTPAGVNPAVNKTGIGNYLPDTSDSAALHAPLSLLSGNTTQTCRLAPYSEGTQTLSGGNGVGGADETSENSATTWTACATVTPIATIADFIFADDFEL